MKTYNLNNTKINILILLLTHILAHYFTFERISYGADTFSDYLRYLSSKDLKIIDYFIISPDRPINFIFLHFQNLILFDNDTLSLISLIISTFLIVISSYIIIFQITKSREFAFLCAIIYDLIPIKSEIFHNIVFLNINFVTCIYLISIISFLQYLHTRNKLYSFISLILYSLAIFWYEIGYFIPIFYISYLIITKVNIRNHLFFFISLTVIAISYLIFRYFDLIFYTQNQESHSINFENNRSFYDIINFVLGKYYFKYVYYGLYQFIKTSIFLKIFLLIFNFIIAFLIYIKIKNIAFLSKVNKNFYIFFLLLFFIFIIPIILNGSAAGRHFIIPTITISFFTIILINVIFKKYKNFVVTFFIFSFLFVAQGNCIIQTNSMKIEKDLINYIKENKTEISDAEFILFDAKSYMLNLEYTLVKNPNNFFNTYFGYQMFEEWGIRSLINIYLENYKYNLDKRIVYSVGEINNLDNDVIEYKTIELKNYGKYEIIQNKSKTENYFIINFEKVYSNSNRKFKTK